MVLVLSGSRKKEGLRALALSSHQSRVTDVKEKKQQSKALQIYVSRNKFNRIHHQARQIEVS